MAGKRVAKRENRKIGGKWEQKKCENNKKWKKKKM